MRTDISDCDAEAILAFLLILSHGHRNFFFVIAKSLSPSLDEIVCPCFEPAMLLDQLKTARLNRLTSGVTKMTSCRLSLHPQAQDCSGSVAPTSTPSEECYL